MGRKIWLLARALPWTLKAAKYGVALLPGVLLSLALAGAALAPRTAEAQGRQARIGGVTVTLAGPEGLTRVDGRQAKADAYIKKTAPKLRLNVLALYAETREWSDFAAAVSAGRPAGLPRFALLCTTTAMPEKSYDVKGIQREFSKYDQWFSLAAGNRPLAALLTVKGNDRLTEILGADIGFQFKMDQFTRKFDQGSDAISFGAKVSFNVFGRPSEVFLTATALAVGDKIVFLGYFEKDGPPAAIEAAQERVKVWRQALARLNAGQYRGGAK